MNINDFSKLSSDELLQVEEISENDFINSLDTETEPIYRAIEDEIKDDFNPMEDRQPFDAPRGDYGANNIGKKVSLNNVVSSDVAFSLIDNLLPLGVVFLLQHFDREATKKQLQATKSEADQIKGILDLCLKQMNVNFDNPFIALGVVLSGVYGSKALEIYLTTEAKPKSTKPNVYEAKKKDGRGRPRKL